jgi:2-dehydropantoate 2-reductase
VNVAVLGPGGVGGLVAGALARGRQPLAASSVEDGVGAPADRGAPRSSAGAARVLVLARESTAQAIAARGLRVSSVLLGDFTAHPETSTELDEPVDALIVATKAAGLADAIARVRAQPRLVLPLLNGLDHLRALRERFGEQAVVAGTIRVEADRPEPGVVVHTSAFLRVDMASRHASIRPPMERLASLLAGAGIPARVHPGGALGAGEAAATARVPAGAAAGPSAPTPPARAADGDGGEAQVMWSKLVRLNALACLTSAYDLPLGPIRCTPGLRAELVGAIEEGCAVARAEGADIPPGDPLGELSAAHETLGSSMQRDIAAGRPPELDAIPGAVLRAAGRHGIECPTIERLVGLIEARLEGSIRARVER